MSAGTIDDSLGLYISIPFCKAKCSFCNFASDVFAGQRLDGYLDRVLAEIADASVWASEVGTQLPRTVDTIYLGGGTPSLLEPAQVQRLFTGLHAGFNVQNDAEITVEAAPGQVAPGTLAAFAEFGVNRLSFGVQSFNDAECAAVGRLHTGAQCLAELRTLAASGFPHTAIDLIVGLPGQTSESWRRTLDDAIASEVEHVSVYILEIDEDSRLGREALSGGKRYGASSLPEDEAIVDWYAEGCERLRDAGVEQYEISNFARPGAQSRHNRKYWERKPYLGFGLDAHSMLRSGSDAVRWANADTMDDYMGGFTRIGGHTGWQRSVERVDRVAAFEETLFLGLRLVEGISLQWIRSEFGDALFQMIEDGVDQAIAAGLVLRADGRLRLTRRGRVVSNEVFSRLLIATPA